MELNEYFINNPKIDNIEQHKMIIILNALENVWTIKKKNQKYIFKKKHNNKKKVFSEKYLKDFITNNL